MARVIFSPTTTPMLPPMNAYSIAATTTGESVEPARRDDHGVLEAGGGDRLLEPLAIRLGVGELQRIVREQVREVLGELALVEQRLEPVGGADAEVMRALRADLQVLLEILVVDQLRAARTLDPQPLGHPARLLGGGGSDRVSGFS